MLMFDPNKSGNKGSGQSRAHGIDLPPGITDQTLSYVVVAGPGGCINLYTQAANKNGAFDKPPFLNTDGQPLSTSFEIWP
jgi:hypothetical protein